MSHNFHFLQSDLVVGILNSVDAISSEKSCPTSMFFLLTYLELGTVESVFPPAVS